MNIGNALEFGACRGVYQIVGTIRVGGGVSAPCDGVPTGRLRVAGAKVNGAQVLVAAHRVDRRVDALSLEVACVGGAREAVVTVRVVWNVHAIVFERAIRVVARALGRDAAEVARRIQTSGDHVIDGASVGINGQRSIVGNARVDGTRDRIIACGIVVDLATSSHRIMHFRGGRAKFFRTCEAIVTPQVVCDLNTSARIADFDVDTQRIAKCVCA